MVDPIGLEYFLRGAGELDDFDVMVEAKASKGHRGLFGQHIGQTRPSDLESGPPADPYRSSRTTSRGSLSSRRPL